MTDIEEIEKILAARHREPFATAVNILANQAKEMAKVLWHDSKYTDAYTVLSGLLLEMTAEEVEERVIKEKEK